MNGIAVARNGLILWENDATGSRKVFKYLLDLWYTIKNQKNVAKVRQCKVEKNQGKTKSQNGVCLVGKLSGHLGRVFLDYLEAPSSHIRQKEK